MSEETGDQNGAPIINFSGEKVALGPLRRELLPYYQRWINEFAVQRNIARIPRPWTMEQERQWIETQLTSERDIPFTIYEKSTMRPIGTTSLSAIDHRNGTAEFGILIGESNCWGKGYGTETTTLVLDYGFTALGLSNIILLVLEFNQAGIRAYQKAGFREIGRRRQAQLMNNRRWDVILMDCLASEFTSHRLADVFAPDEPRASSRLT